MNNRLFTTILVAALAILQVGCAIVERQRESRAFGEALKLNTVAGWKGFLSQYPHYKSDRSIAEKLLKSAREENTSAAYSEYAERFKFIEPYYSEAREAEKDALEREAWSQVDVKIVAEVIRFIQAYHYRSTVHAEALRALDSHIAATASAERSAILRLFHEEPRVRAYAAYELRRVGTPLAIPFLETLLSDKSDMWWSPAGALWANPTQDKYTNPSIEAKMTIDKLSHPK